MAESNQSSFAQLSALFAMPKPFAHTGEYGTDLAPPPPPPPPPVPILSQQVDADQLGPFALAPTPTSAPHVNCVMEHVPSPAPMLQQQHKRPFIDLNEPYVERAASQPAETSSRVRPISYGNR